MSVKARSKPRTKPLEVRRDDLMNAAQELFLRQGVGPTKVDQITAAAEVAKGTFYLYFESKDDVLVALRDRFRQSFIREVDAAIAKVAADDWTGKLHAWIRTAAIIYIDAVPLHDLVFHHTQCSRRDKLRHNQAVAHLAGLFTAGAAAKAWAIERPQETAVFLLYGLHGIIDLALIADRPPVRRHLLQAAVELTDRIIGRAAERPATHPAAAPAPLRRIRAASR